jgi:serpin B
VNEQGTRAGAATAVEMNAKGILMNPKEVVLDRPFVYLLIDVETGVPFFVGVLNDPA